MKHETDCEKCRHGNTVHGPAAMRTVNGTVVLAGPGGKVTTCTKETVSRMDMTDAGMVCSDFAPREAGTDAG